MITRTAPQDPPRGGMGQCTTQEASDHRGPIRGASRRRGSQNTLTSTAQVPAAGVEYYEAREKHNPQT